MTTNYEDPGIAERAQGMEKLMRTYFDACNAADVDKMMACFMPEAVHYFPPDMYDGPFVGARKIAEKWRDAVVNLGSYWSVDRLIVDPLSHQAVMEWTHFKTKQDKILRGIEWYEFDAATGLISEIRAYYASPQAPSLQTLALGGFDYADRGYPAAPPAGAR
jgi:methyltransferase